ncbi:hypothetical protein HC766_05845 [Candidatus Gracilibacteria bacterium]|nr:hypothetical protein [Thermales bacterium]NJL96900.1 hypothetical protein [Candidatus Gracilibacteria bacterium]NJS41815.1 hypothetical protein [Candidatus Gracilibacteria bacterium]
MIHGKKFDSNELPSNLKAQLKSSGTNHFFEIKGFGRNTIRVNVDNNDRVESFVVKGGLFGGSQVEYQKFQ